MTVEVLEHNGIYSVYRRVVKRGDNGQLYESAKRIYLSFPPPDRSQWPNWATSLTHDELDASMQVFFDRWNFGRGTDEEGAIHQCLCSKQERRRREDTPVITIPKGSKPAPAFSFDGDSNTGIYTDTKGKATLHVRGVKVSP